MSMFDFKTTTRIECVCRNAQCGLRRVTMPFEIYQRAHGIECDRCGLPMTCVAVSAPDRQGNAVVWSDVVADPVRRFLRLA